ncbi:membrane protein DedA with SNARE-associated domain [Trueperella bonasi]|uniref:Membrane protein DedA with SNARE-associated domain n=1 Tax=Trueperella bonasi TaxID=312286 RepID=A0ABT9NI73_9ACTO|nr:DedA family protein [Trueperella bonasi]MDP9807029.1 membrane protein DedA with SNARE-associated domain [Trueperella bonasi]
MANVIDPIMDFINNGPVVFVYLFLFFGAFTRAQTTYWIGRYMGKFIMTRGRPDGGWRLRLYKRIHAPSTEHAIEVLQRRGWPLIPLSFLTVGFQTLVQLSAGLIRMRWPRYTPAMIPGALAWALIYTTIGWAVWSAAIGAVAGSPIVVVGAIALLVVFFVWRARRGNRAVIAAISKDDGAGDSTGSQSEDMSGGETTKPGDIEEAGEAVTLGGDSGRDSDETHPQVAIDAIRDAR